MFFFQLLLTTIYLNGVSLDVEIARTKEEHARGLQGRESLAENAGMLFVFDEPQILHFWMEDTLIPLSIGYFDANRRLFQIEPMSPKTPQKLYPSKKPALYALEVSPGWFYRHRVRIGDRLEFSND